MFEFFYYGPPRGPTILFALGPLSLFLALIGFENGCIYSYLHRSTFKNGNIYSHRNQTFLEPKILTQTETVNKSFDLSLCIKLINSQKTILLSDLYFFI